MDRPSSLAVGLTALTLLAGGCSARAPSVRAAPTPAVDLRVDSASRVRVVQWSRTGEFALGHALAQRLDAESRQAFRHVVRPVRVSVSVARWDVEGDTASMQQHQGRISRVRMAAVVTVTYDATWARRLTRTYSYTAAQAASPDRTVADRVSAAVRRQSPTDAGMEHNDRLLTAATADIVRQLVIDVANQVTQLGAARPATAP